MCLYFQAFLFPVMRLVLPVCEQGHTVTFNISAFNTVRLASHIHTASFLYRITNPSEHQQNTTLKYFGLLLWTIPLLVHLKDLIWSWFLYQNMSEHDQNQFCRSKWI